MDKLLTMSSKEITRLEAMQRIKDKRLTQKEAARLLNMSVRQVKRLYRAYKAQGAQGLISARRGKPSNHRLDEEVTQQVLDLLKEKYEGFGPTLAHEKLSEVHGIWICRRESVRKLMIVEGLWKPKKARKSEVHQLRERRAPEYRGRRERYPQAGMMLQTDGSRHDWLEGCGPWLTLVAMIDDANNEVPWAIFREEEDAAGYFLVLEQVCRSRGIPQSIYADQHTIFQSPSQPSIEQELYSELPRTQFGRLVDELGIQLIAARSPQAKGRVERLWGTLQDRLVKELRKVGANDPESVNRVLAAYLPKFNARFEIKAAQPGSAYLPWPADRDPALYFCFKYTRTVTNDNTIPFNNYRLQIPPGPGSKSYAKARVDLHHAMDGSLAVFYQGQHLVTFQPATSAPPRVGLFTLATPATPPAKPQATTLPKQPRQPWRQSSISLKGRKLR